jgi:class 3 adenylate cyclase
VGDATQQAAELARQATPGAILVSAATARLVYGEVCLEAYTPELLPAQTDPSMAYQVRGLDSRHAPCCQTGRVRAVALSGGSWS